MKPKKNPKADLTKNSSLYFAIGLFLTMGVTWAAIEWRTYENLDATNSSLTLDDMLDEEVPLVQLNTPPPPPPPPPPPAPVEIEIVDNKEEIEEIEIQSTEIDKDEVMNIDDVEMVDEPVDVKVPFSVIEDVPVFPGCERKKKEKRRECFQKKMNDHINKYFNYPEIAKEMGVQGRVSVMFVIEKDGSIKGIQARGPDKSLEKEAKRIISKLPKMTPGKQRGKAVRVPFAIPITFRLQ